MASMTDSGATPSLTPFVELGRADWSELARSTPQPLSETEVVQLRGIGDVLDMREVAEVYLPLSRLLNLYAAGTQHLHRATSDFLGERAARTPRKSLVARCSCCVPAA